MFSFVTKNACVGWMIRSIGSSFHHPPLQLRRFLGDALETRREISEAFRRYEHLRIAISSRSFLRQNEISSILVFVHIQFDRFALTTVHRSRGLTTIRNGIILGNTKDGFQCIKDGAHEFCVENNRRSATATNFGYLDNSLTGIGIRPGIFFEVDEIFSVSHRTTIAGQFAEVPHVSG